MKQINNDDAADGKNIINLRFTELKRTELTSGTTMLKQSRLHGVNNDEVYQLFNQRVVEMATIKRLSQQIEEAMGKLRPKFEQEIKSDAIKIDEIRIEIKKMKSISQNPNESLLSND